jgi:glycerate-2-kinase
MTRPSIRSSSSQTLQEQEMTNDALSIVKAAIDAVNPYTAVQTHILGTKPGSLRIGSNTYKEQDYDSAVIVSFGKASSAMAVATV